MDVNFPALEERILKHWKEQKAFEKSLERRKNAPRFVFYEGPPTANAGPGIHHVLSRVFKDVICRYKTMQGFFVPRKAGWDTHGLPVELQVEKKLGFKSKKDIEEYGIAKFNAACKQSVWEFKKEWEQLTERVGFWIDMEHPYVTYEPSYMETLWYIIKRFWDAKLLYKDYKVVPYCARCGTPLSSHELAQGYKTVKDRSVYVKFKVKGEDSTFLIAWTTTPWTLPANVALAVRSNVEYRRIKFLDDYRSFKKGETYIAASSFMSKQLPGFAAWEESSKVQYPVERLISTIEGSAKILDYGYHKGENLVRWSYEPLFPYFTQAMQGAQASTLKNAHKVYAADFVSTEDGTGIVHTAVMYGADDFELGKEENLPMHHLVDEMGKFSSEVEPWKGMFVKDADPFIIQELKKQNLLFKEELVEHEYPFCWRCSTPLLYYAMESWFVNMQKVKKELLKNNEKINWIPSHIQKGRMGEWLQEVKDWAFSRKRYWGTPLPIWECNSCSHKEVIGSLEDLKSQKSSNAYTLLRHAHSERQLVDILSSWPEKKQYKLTKKGVQEALKAARKLKKQHIDLIFSSDLRRTRQTAELVGKELGLAVQFDPRLREQDVGEFNGKPLSIIGKKWAKKGETEMDHYLRRFRESFPGGENWKDVQSRMYGFMKDMEKRYHGKRILVISHEAPLTILQGTLQGFAREDIIRFRQRSRLETGEMRKISFASLPYNNEMELDLHRPFIDEVMFPCAQCERGTMKRVADVVDVWFDSGAMPFAQAYWPFAKPGSLTSKSAKSKLEVKLPKAPELFPADYIVEGIDQTRGWFYTLLATSTLLGFGPSYKNALVLGHILDEKGEKMSKSKGNVVNPWDMIAAYGADAIRWYFYTHNHAWDPKLFAEKDIAATMRRFLLILSNCLVFYQTYASKSQIKSSHVLDRWILSRLHTTIFQVTKALDAYDVTGAARTLEEFVVQDISLWYIRRSRMRFQNPSSKKELMEASGTLGSVLEAVAVLAAPFLPFFAEHVHQRVRSHSNDSVHWMNWPRFQKTIAQSKMEQEMQDVRVLAAQALALRSKAGIKVRQPLSTLVVKKPISQPLLQILQEELNVKEVRIDSSITEDVVLDTKVSPALAKEGMLREVRRAVQDMRKKAGYRPVEKIAVRYEGSSELEKLIEETRVSFMKGLHIKTLRQGKKKGAYKEQGEVRMNNTILWIGLL